VSIISPQLSTKILMIKYVLVSWELYVLKWWCQGDGRVITFFYAEFEHLTKEKYIEVVHAYIETTSVRSNAFNNDKVLMPL